MRETLSISAGDLRAEIVPSLGAGLARFDISRNGRPEPIFRSWPEEGTNDPNDLAAYVLVPWSNRISRGGFEFGGKFHPLEPNFPPEPYPLHGNGWISEWTTVQATPDRVELGIMSDGPGPFRYRAGLTYELSPSTLRVQLWVKNRAAIALPYGLGFHPWLPRTADTRLLAGARSVWLEDGRHLPTTRIEVRARPQWDFSMPRPLPDGWINNGFEGWNGQAVIDWPSRGLALAITASELLSTYILYSPNSQASFFCFEPVSHVVDAHNLPGNPVTYGLSILAPAETMDVGCRFQLSAQR
jgi:aldose 1-epimerase